MDYEKKYKEAQGWIEKIYPTLQHEQQMEAEAFFPELAESEDERIRKELIEFVDINTLSVDERHDRWLSWLEKQGEPQDKGEISDGYHTFNELYYYRMLYNAAFFNILPKEWVHKSKRHNDGEECFGGGWFIVMANLPTGQISNHYELKDWDLFQIPEKEVADKWDGHTPQEAADRLHKYLLEKQSEQKPFDYENANIAQKDFAPKVEPKFKVKYAGSEYNVLEIKDIAGVAFYGIEDEPNHIDYVKAENCEIISGYGIKENGSPYPTKPADKVEPKFKNGQWIVWRDKCYKVNYNGCGYELVDQNGLSTSLEYGTVDESAHLWDITKDAKDGDVLAYGDNPNDCHVEVTMIFKSVRNEKSAFTHFHFFDDKFRVNDWCDCGKNAHPATKEQRDTLFAKMKEAGYEWDAEKKELKKINSYCQEHCKDYQVTGKCFADGECNAKREAEQELADKVEPFDKYEGLTDFERTLADICIGWIGEELGWKQYIKDNADVLLKIAVEKFNSVQDVPFEQKTAWSEEDEKNTNRIIDAIKSVYCIEAIDGTYDFKKIFAWLKSLKQRCTWKPSDEQMEVLKEATNIVGSKYKSCLNSLYSDLKKLKD